MRRFARILSVLVAWIALVGALLHLNCCAATPHQVAAGAVSTAGALTATLHREHQRIYREATDALRERIAAAHGTIADYDREVAPLDRELVHRGDALAALSAALYASAAVIDAARGGAAPAEYAEAARSILVALDEAVGAIESGAILPPVTLPPEVDAVRSTLRALIGGHDGGR